MGSAILISDQGNVLAKPCELHNNVVLIFYANTLALVSCLLSLQFNFTFLVYKAVFYFTF